MSNQPNGEWSCLGAFILKQGYGEKSQKTSMRDCFLSSPQSAASQGLVSCGDGGWKQHNQQSRISAPHLPAFIRIRKVGMLSMTGLGWNVAAR